MGLFKKTARGIGWMGGLRFSSRLLSLLKTAILARLLSPVQFGVFGIVTLVISLFEILTETGINTILIQEDEEVDSFINTAWVISIFRGFFISLLIALCAFPLSRFFSSLKTAKFLLFASLVPLIRGFINPAIIKFQKNLEFRKEFNLRFIILLAESLTAIVWALLTHSVFSLILGLIVAAFSEVLLSFIFCRPRPRFALNRQKAKKIISRGKWITLTGIFSYLVSQGDDAVVGKILGMESLGLYQMAYRISNLPFTEITDVFSRVTFPVYSKISQDKKRVKKAFKKTLLVITLFVVPGVAIIFFFPHLIIKIILGEKWLGATQALKILALFGLSRAISGFAGPVFYAFKRQDLVAKINFLKLVVLAFLIFPLTIKFGITGTALAVLFSSFSVQPMIWKNVRKILQ